MSYRTFLHKKSILVAILGPPPCGVIFRIGAQEEHMGDFTLGGEWLLKNVPIFFYGKIQTSINISIDGLLPTCRYQLRVSRGPHKTILGHALVELDELGQIRQIRWKNNFFLCSDFTPFMSKSFQIWNHFLPILLLKDSEYLGSLDIGLWEVVLDLNMFAPNQPRIALAKQVFDAFFFHLCTLFKRLLAPTSQSPMS